MQSLLSPDGVYSPEDVDLALARVFGAGVRPLHLEEALFEAMLVAWAAQMVAERFGFHQARAAKWAREAGRTYADYVALRTVQRSALARK